MKTEELIKKKIRIAEKKISELIESRDLKPLSENEKYETSKFYEEKSKNRLETAKLIYNASKNSGKDDSNVRKDYRDYGEVVAAAYYSMYYIVHSFIALEYKKKLKEGLRGVHVITECLILNYLVKTKKLAKHLYENYLRTFQTTAQIQNITIEDFQKKAYEYVKRYDEERTAREIFTYNTTPNVEEYHATRAINSAEEFINTIRQLMI